MSDNSSQRFVIAVEIREIKASIEPDRLCNVDLYVVGCATSHTDVRGTNALGEICTYSVPLEIARQLRVGDVYQLDLLSKHLVTDA